MENYIKVAVIANLIEAQVIESLLQESQIPYRIRSFHDTAYDGLFQFQKGWGELYVPKDKKEEIDQIIAELRSDGGTK